MTPTRETIARAICEETNGCSAGGCSIGVKPESCLRRHGGTADAVLRALDAAGLAVVPTDPASEARRGLEWFERTFGVPLGDMPGRLDVERVRAMIAAAPDGGPK